MPPPQFQAFTLKFNGTANRIISDISVAEAFDPGATNPHPQHHAAKALWDTGATKSVISDKLAKVIGLIPTGIAEVRHAGGVSQSPTYLVNFALPHRVGVVGVQVTEFPETSGRFGVIVGMDVICLGDLALTNLGGHTWMSFRMPSCATVDYVVEHNRQLYAGVARNAPCPCGAQKPDGTSLKFKHCHGAT